MLLLGDDSRRPDKAIIVEAQTDIDRDKEWTWPFYLSGLRVRLRCPTVLVVVAVDREVERWAREAIDLGDGCCTMRPFVLGAGDVPIITEAEVAGAAPELAVLSVAAHAAEPPGEAIVRALDAARGLDRDRQIFYVDFVFAFLKEVAPNLLEKFMATSEHKFFSDFARKYYDNGEAKGIAGSLISLLQQRGFEITDVERQRILECGDLDQLQTWLGRVLTAKSLAEVFGD